MRCLRAAALLVLAIEVLAAPASTLAAHHRVAREFRVGKLGFVKAERDALDICAPAFMAKYDLAVAGLKFGEIGAGGVADLNDAGGVDEISDEDCTALKVLGADLTACFDEPKAGF